MTLPGKALNECLSANIPFVCYREAGKAIKAFTGNVRELNLANLRNENLPAGFLFAPFDLHHQKTYFIEETAELTIQHEQLEQTTTGLTIQHEQLEQTISGLTFQHEQLKQTKADLAAHSGQLAQTSATTHKKSPFPDNRLISTELSDYTSEFDTYLGRINRGELQKVVASRRTLVPALQIPEYALLFNALTETYPNAFVYWIFLPGICSWMGASPETLLASNGQIAKTMSLAGTRHPDQAQAAFGDKEKNEQQLVSTAIENVIRNYTSNIKMDGPAEIAAGRLKHLQTSYTFDLPQKDFLPLALDLHPTPAVGGVPKDLAWDIILKTEVQPRNFYCGFLGYLHPTFGGSLFVNLRCMEIFNENIGLYTGGGLTEDSNLMDEWKETGYKNETLLSVIEKIRKFAGK